MTRNRRLIAAVSAAAIVAFTSGAALAADTQKTWQGLVTIYTVTSQCASANTEVGDFVTAVYRPKLASTNTNTFLSFIYSRAAMTFQNMSEATRPQMRGAGNYTSTGINGRAKSFSNSSTYSFTITPATITASTPSVTINGKINNYFATVGCTVTFAGGFGRRPN